MQQENLFLFYSEKQRLHQQQLTRIESNTAAITWLRLLFGVASLLLVYLSVDNSLLLWGAIPASVLFLVLVSIHIRWNRKRTFLQHLVQINQAELKALKGDHSSFASGEEFIDPDHSYTHDLDIYGPNSIFQLINRTSTETGKYRLAGMLSNPLKEKGKIVERQQSIMELSGKVDFRQSFQAIGMMSKEKREDQRKLLEWLKLDTLVYGKKWLTYSLILFPALSFLSGVYWILSDTASPFILISFVQLVIIGTHARRVVLFQNYVGDKRALLQTFTHHFDLINKEHFVSTLSKQIRENSAEAYLAVNQLSKLARALDLRLNIFAFLLFNTTVLYDLLCVYRLERWREQHKDRLEKWLRSIEEMDALISAATYAFNHPNFVFAEITDGMELNAKSLGHPLIPESNRVSSDVLLSAAANVWIVTGANMAGKSTFLRTVGVNTVLALAGFPVCSSGISCPVLEVHSGMRTTDSITDHQSYFFAELLRLQTIMGHLRQGKKSLILLDEILKGTNSSDKLAGSQALVRQLVASPALCLIATHDVALGEMSAEYAAIVNYHFETTIVGDELSFDYMLKPGISTGKNATFLMKKMGIIADN